MARWTEPLREKIDKELDEMAAKRDLSTADLDRAWKLTSISKNICKVEEMAGGYSGDGMWTARGDYYRDGNSRAYDQGSSYRHRDSMGRYARDGYPRDGYSGGSMQEHLDAMLRDARTEEERRMIEDMRRKMA